MKTSIFKLMLGVVACLLAGCTTTDFEEEASEPAKQDEVLSSMKMNFRINVITFDSGQTATRGDDNWTWKEGDVVYLQYNNGSSVIRGHAVYTASTDSWEAFWNGTLGTTDKCEVYYFAGASTNDKHAVSLNASQAVYADKTGNYSVNGTEITIQASLKPLTSRIRFKGKSGLGIEVSGVAVFTGYDADKNEFATTGTIEGQVGSDGFTPYYYCTFADDSKREMAIINSQDGDDVQFVKSFGASVLRTGESGYITIPTEDTNKGWTIKTPPTEQEFTVTGNGKTVTFKMIKVKSGTFEMGSTSGDVHSVTLTKSYYMGETEVTQALWYAVMGEKPTAYGSKWDDTRKQGDNYPAYYISYEDCEQFLTKLNQLTGQKFRFPTEAEWEFAAKGGTKSKGYTYAGSNTIGDVAWYTVNSYELGSSNANYGTHVVKTKSSNELGLYDMSGNVWEWCYDWYGSYSSTAQTDPTGATTGSNRVYRGGGWSSSAADCRTANRNYNSPSDCYSNLGFRLAL